jgi:hypothetical protein
MKTWRRKCSHWIITPHLGALPPRQLPQAEALHYVGPGSDS